MNKQIVTGGLCERPLTAGEGEQIEDFVNAS
jgi:hypothetical protein